MRVNPVQSWRALPLQANVADDPRVVIERARPSEARTSTGVPMVRVIEGELLGRNSDAAAYDMALRWLMNNSTVQCEPGNPGLNVHRAHEAIGSYLDTAIMSGLHGTVRPSLDLYA